LTSIATIVVTRIEEDRMKNKRITSITLAFTLLLLALGYTSGLLLINSIEDYMERTTAQAIRTMGE